MAPGFLNAVFWRGVAILSALVTGLVTLRLLGKFLEPSNYGVVVVATQMLGYLSFLDGGFRTTVNRELLANSDPVRRQVLLRFGQTLYTALGLGAIAVALIVMAGYGLTPLATSSNEPITLFLVVGFASALMFVVGAQGGLLVGLRGQAETFILNALNVWLNLGALWLGLRNGLGLWAFPIAQLVMTAGSFPLVLWLIRRREPGLKFFSLRFDEEFRGLLRGMKGAAYACFRSQVSIMLLFTLDVILVGMICGAKAAASYGVLTRVFNIIRSLLQATGEAAWPIVAQRGSGGFALPLLRINAWLYGAVIGAVWFTLLPFIEWYMGSDWTSSRLVLGLVAARCLITGVSSLAAYCLIGLGKFQEVSRYIIRELAFSCLAAVPLGMWFGTAGVAAAFLVATVFGTLTPIMAAFGHAEGYSAWWLLRQSWWRALAGLAISLGTVLGLLHWLAHGPLVLAAAAGAVTVVMVAALLLAAARSRTAWTPWTWASLRNLLKRV